MRLTILLVVGLAFTAAGVLAGDGDDANKDDLGRLQGKWKVVLREIDGQAYKTDGFAWTISGNKMVDGGGSGCYAAFTLDAKAAPKTIDHDQYDARGKPFTGATGFKGIYAFDGPDRLKWCVTGTTGRPRPEAFESKRGDGNIFYILERVKE